MEQNIQNIKIELIQWLTTLEDKSVIKRLVELRNSHTKDWWDEISTEERVSIENGIKDANSGKLSSHSEARKIYKKWL
jgi:hypothetical protein